jgi:hypothetical protein
MKGNQRKSELQQETEELLHKMSPEQVLMFTKLIRKAYVQQVVKTERELDPALLRDLDKGIALLTKRG